MGTEVDQAALWNGRAGRAWVDGQELLDQMYKPIEDLLVAAVVSRPRRRVLDIGCGTGGTTRAIARRLAPAAGCVGVDISEPMLAVARASAARERLTAEFVLADAQSHAFDAASFDMMVSRFGVMFFADPVGAFANLRRAATDDGELQFIAWRSAAENPFMTAAERAAAPLLPTLPQRRPDAPGQFGFADSDRVRTILTESGWTGIDVRPIDVECTLPETELVRYLTRFGPVGMVLDEVDDDTRVRVIEAARAAFEPFVHGSDVRFTAACWAVRAEAR